MKYDSLAKEILKKIGGEDNVKSLVHCMTRLRFKIVDRKKIDKSIIEKIDGVVRVIESGGQFQVVIGEHVGEVYKAILAISNIGFKSDKDMEETLDNKENAKLLDRAIDFISAIFMPIIPAFIGAGLLKGILMILSSYCGVSNTSQTYQIMYAASDALSYFLPVLIAWSTAKKLKVNIGIAISVVAFLIYPDIITLLGTNDSVKFVGINVYKATYSYGVMSAILTVSTLYFIDKGIKKVLPRQLHSVFVPLLDIAITAPLVLIVVGPLGAMIGSVLSIGYSAVYNFNPIIAGILIGGVWQLLVVFGMHYAFVPIMMNNLAVMGVDPISALAGPAGVAQLAACLGASFAARNPEIRKLAKTLFFTCFFGCVAEPALYGINLKYKTPFIAGLIGGAVGGGIVGAVGAVALAPVPFGIYTLAAYAGKGFIGLCIAAVIAFILSMGITYFVGIDEGIR